MEQPLSEREKKANLAANALVEAVSKNNSAEVLAQMTALEMALQTTETLPKDNTVQETERIEEFHKKIDEEIRILEAVNERSFSPPSKAGFAIIGSALLGVAMWASGIMDSFTNKTPKKELTPQESAAIKEAQRKFSRMLSPLAGVWVGIKGEFDIPGKPWWKSDDKEMIDRRMKSIEKENEEEAKRYAQWKKDQDEEEALKNAEKEKKRQEQEALKKTAEQEQRMRGRR